MIFGGKWPVEAWRMIIHVILGWSPYSQTNPHGFNLSWPTKSDILQQKTESKQEKPKFGWSCLMVNILLMAHNCGLHPIVSQSKNGLSSTFLGANAFWCLNTHSWCPSVEYYQRIQKMVLHVYMSLFRILCLSFLLLANLSPSLKPWLQCRAL